MNCARVAALVVAAVVGSFGVTAPASAQLATTPPPAGPGTIVGRVTDAEHRPIADAEVRIGRLDRSTRTTPDGFYRFDSLAEGRYDLRVRRIGYEAQSRAVSVNERGGSITFIIKAVPQRLEPVITAISRGGLGGFVIDAKRQPLPGATIRALGAAARTVTDSAGEFFIDVKPGTFMLHVTTDGYSPRLISVTVPKDSGRLVVIALEPGKAASAREEIELEDLRKRLVWRTSPAAIFGREKLDALTNKRLTALVRSVNPNPVEETCMALVDGGPDLVPLWYLDADELEAVEIYPRGTLSYVTGNRRQSAIVRGREQPPPDASLAEFLRAGGAARTCPFISVWLR